MPIYVVTPHQGVGPISFGMPRTAVQAAMKLPPETFHKVGAQTLVDAYLDACFQVFYDAAHTVEYIELSRGGLVTALYQELDALATAAE